MWLLRSLSYFLTWFPVLALLSVFGLLAARRLYRELPYFFAYVLYALLIGVARYAAYYASRGLYPYVYVVTELVGVIVVAFALYEVFVRRLFAKFYKVRFYRGLFAVVACLLLVLTILTALQAPDKSKAFGMVLRAYDFVRTGVLVFMVALMAVMGRQWTRYDFGIALGFAVQAATALVNAAMRVRLHRQSTAMDMVEAVSFAFSCLIWLITFWTPERPSALVVPDQLDAEMLQQARSWELVLKTWLTPKRSKQTGAG
jgi:hypothetical protein